MIRLQSSSIRQVASKVVLTSFFSCFLMSHIFVQLHLLPSKKRISSVPSVTHIGFSFVIHLSYAFSRRFYQFVVLWTYNDLCWAGFYYSDICYNMLTLVSYLCKMPAQCISWLSTLLACVGCIKRNCYCPLITGREVRVCAQPSSPHCALLQQ